MTSNKNLTRRGGKDENLESVVEDIVLFEEENNPNDRKQDASLGRKPRKDLPRREHKKPRQGL